MVRFVRSNGSSVAASCGGAPMDSTTQLRRRPPPNPREPIGGLSNPGPDPTLLVGRGSTPGPRVLVATVLEGGPGFQEIAVPGIARDPFVAGEGAGWIADVRVGRNVEHEVDDRCCGN